MTLQLTPTRRRDSKVHGGQVGDQNSDLTYNNISKQIDEGVKEGFADAEVVRGVLRIIKPGAFKDMLVNKHSITVSELKGFLRSHLGEKATTELFQELMCARQLDQEPPQQFLYRMIRLKQKILFQSRQASADISYDPKIISDENEHQRRLGQPPRQKTTQAYSAKVEERDHNNNKSTASDNKNIQTMQQLTSQVETLTHMVVSLMEQRAASTRVSYSFSANPLQTSPTTVGTSCTPGERETGSMSEMH
ncbi:hypothetical protein DPEC_G00125410 [Dallia pectoralis]|uniref:Uncharacterized protein n=1 Tax=Dallia pectoralis TaxID=75939 RepID=A0ACC2GRI8_DALPE|nr:hypothetical protein DPEC_G00125410 [Dallia pectoralis]